MTPKGGPYLQNDITSPEESSARDRYHHRSQTGKVGSKTDPPVCFSGAAAQLNVRQTSVID